MFFNCVCKVRVLLLLRVGVKVFTEVAGEVFAVDQTRVHCHQRPDTYVAQSGLPPRYHCHARGVLL
jgi:hypothetical protein